MIFYYKSHLIKINNKEFKTGSSSLLFNDVSALVRTSLYTFTSSTNFQTIHLASISSGILSFHLVHMAILFPFLFTRVHFRYSISSNLVIHYNPKPIQMFPLDCLFLWFSFECPQSFHSLFYPFLKHFIFISKISFLSPVVCSDIPWPHPLTHMLNWLIVHFIKHCFFSFSYVPTPNSIPHRIVKLLYLTLADHLTFYI